MSISNIINGKTYFLILQTRKTKLPKKSTKIKNNPNKKLIPLD